MSRREASPGFGERMRKARMRLGYSTAADFARKAGLNYQTYRQWEVFDSAPSMSTLKKAMRVLEVPDWERLVLWLADGEGEPPAWLVSDGPLDLEQLRKDHASGSAVRPTGPRAPVPWRAVETLAQQAKAAQAKGDDRELAAIESEFFNLVRMSLPRTTHPSPSQSQAGQDHPTEA
jgi:transcriptional regulator with XRE-family HTH domain